MQPIYHIWSAVTEELVALNTAQSRFQTLLLTAFAAIALLLAAIGLYAVLSYMVRSSVPMKLACEWRSAHSAATY